MISGPPTRIPDPKRLIRELFEAVDARDAERIAPFLADDVTFQFGSGEALVGKQSLLATSREFCASIADIHHEATDLWNPEPGIAVVVLRVTYRRLDGQTLTLPCCNIFRIRDGLVNDYRIFMDVTPVFA